MARFVVVDDSKLARTFLKNILVKAGHEVVAEGADGVEGYELYLEHKPDIITLDMVMPISNGLDCLQKVVRACPEASAVMVTSVGKDNFIDEAMSLGAKAVIIKPIQESEVLAVIGSLV